MLDDGAGRSVLRGATPPLLAHLSVPFPAVAAAVTVDEPGERQPHRGAYPLVAGIVPGAGAVISASQAAASTVRLPVAQPPRGDLTPEALTVPIGRVRRATPRILDEPTETIRANNAKSSDGR